MCEACRVDAYVWKVSPIPFWRSSKSSSPPCLGVPFRIIFCRSTPAFEVCLKNEKMLKVVSKHLAHFSYFLGSWTCTKHWQTFARVLESSSTRSNQSTTSPKLNSTIFVWNKFLLRILDSKSLPMLMKLQPMRHLLSWWLRPNWRGSIQEHIIRT